MIWGEQTDEVQDQNLRQPRIVKVWVNGRWEVAELLEDPNSHPDPPQRRSGWKVRFATGNERFIWDSGDIIFAPAISGAEQPWPDI